MLKPSDEEFIEWTKKDQNKAKIEGALTRYPDLVHIRKEVCFDVACSLEKC